MLGYRTFVNVPSCDGDLTGLVLGQLHSWLRNHKRYDADALTVGEDVELAPGVQGLLLERSGQDGRTTRFHLTENSRQGRWVTDLTVHEPSGFKRPPVVWIDVQSPIELFTKTPRLARQILDIVDAYDGSAHLTATPAIVRADGVEAMVDVICDPDRRGLAFIAGSDHGLPLDRWSELVTDLLVDTSGLAAAYVLDAEATELFDGMVGSTHSVQPGTLRTYLPEADPADPADAFRHRILSTQRILRGESARLKRTLGWKARELSLTQPLPRWAARLGEQLEATIDAAVVSGTTSVPTPQAHETRPAIPISDVSDDAAVDTIPALDPRADTTPSAPAEPAMDHDPVPTAVIDLTTSSALVEQLGSRLGLRVANEDDIRTVVNLVVAGLRLPQVQDASRSRLDEVQVQLRAAKEQQASLQGRLDDEILDHALTTRDGLSALEDVQRLRLLLMEAGQGKAAWTVDSSRAVDLYPETFEDLLDRIEGLDGVVFTGDIDVTVELDKHADVNTWASKAYQSLRALSDYAACKVSGEIEGDFDAYLKSTPPGRAGWSVNRHARDESPDVRSTPKYYRPRLLPVPEVVVAEGSVFMGAHIKIAQAGMISPRLHYYDDTSRSGTVFVGYIGRHLPTQRTN